MQSLKRMIAGEKAVFAPLVLNPLMARLAEKAGFEALYLGGGASGYLKTWLEANLSITEMAQAGMEIKSVSSLPLILDGACGWGDPMHMHHTVGMAEAAGFAAIEIEDQILPKRAHHHIGVEHMVPTELMAEKVREAAAARRDPDFLLIARTNGVRSSDIDDAIRRAEAYKAAGADLLLLSPRNADEARYISERVEGPLMYLCSPGGLGAIGLSLEEMTALGFKLIADPSTALFAAYETFAGFYRNLADGLVETSRSPEEWREIEKRLHADIGIADLIDIEKRTVER